MPQANGKRPARRGRPAGATNRPAGARSWEPKQWKPVYEQMLLLQLMGRKQTDIAEIVNRSIMSVSLVLGSQKAAQRKGEILRELQQEAIEGITDKIDAAAIKAADRVVSLMNDDEKFAEAPFAVARTAIDLLKGVGKLKTDAARTQIDKAIILTTEHSNDLLDGLVEADQVKKLYAGSGSNQS